MVQVDFFESAARKMATSRLRQSNERAVLTALAIQPGAPAATLARITGLRPNSIARILVDLERDKLIARGEPLRGMRGQPATPIGINPGGAYSVGCEIGWRHLTVVLCNLTGQRLGEYRRDFPYPDPYSLVAEVTSLVSLMLNLIPDTERDRVASLGVAMPSGLARNISLVGADQNTAADWGSLDIAAQLQNATGLPTFLMNDGNAACWAELVLRPRPRPDNFAYISIGTFVSGGVVAEGRLWEGATGRAANLGSIMVSDGDGGRQFGHLVCSLYALEQSLGRAGMTAPKRDPRTWIWDEFGAVGERWLANSAAALAEIISSTAAVSEIRLAVIDGTLPEPVLQRLVDETRLSLTALPILTDDHPDVQQGAVGNLAAATGAAFRPLYRQFFARDPAQMTADV